ncbi:hypothetical protein GF312_06850 [Candidatus Poribacteria bacterium]|nr:hypothetical protein [Candidatus Poribacteria bacterium]
MSRLYAGFFVFILVVGLWGCASVRKTIIAEQEWSENYAMMEDVEITDPKMADGNKRTEGETQSPVDSRGTTEFTEALVKFPEKKSVRRIVLYTSNIEDMSLYAAGDDEGVWKPLEDIDNNQEKMLEFDVGVDTDAIRIRVRGTSDDERLPGTRSRSGRRRRAKGKIQELEIYGYVDKTETPGATESGKAFVTTADGSLIPAQQAEPEIPPAELMLETPKNTYSLAEPIPVKVNIEVGEEQLVVLAYSVKDETICTRLTVKNAAGETIACTKPKPKIDPIKPYRGAGKPVNVRNAETLDAESVKIVEIADLKEYYPITEAGTYTVQMDMSLENHTRYVGRIQTQISDLERTIRDVNSRSNYSQTEKAGIVQGLKDEIEQLKKKKGKRYIVIGSKGEMLELSSNKLELTVQ